jgi:hypothetical protein
MGGNLARGEKPAGRNAEVICRLAISDIKKKSQSVMPRRLHAIAVPLFPESRSKSKELRETAESPSDAACR